MLFLERKTIFIHSILDIAMGMFDDDIEPLSRRSDQ